MTTVPETSRRMQWLLGMLAALAAYALVWPVCRAFLPIEINRNESWNAYLDDAAVRGGALYPAADRLTTNNYPPLSFYVTGAAGALLGDTILAGRLLSLAAVGLIGWGVGRTVVALGGSRAAAWTGGLFFVATLCQFYTVYAGMNDPQLLAQAVMLFGFTAFLKAVDRDRGYLLPVAVMVAAGFMKHNVVTLPLVAFVWLGLNRPRRVLPWGGAAVLLAAGGLALCRAVYGSAFFANLLAPRGSDVMLMLGYLGRLQSLAVGLVVWAYVGVALRRVPAVRLCNLLVLVGFAAFAAQKVGEGVGPNSLFDLLIALSIAVGVAFAQAGNLPVARVRTPEQLRSGLLLAVCLRLAATPQWEPVRLLFDPAFREQIAVRTRATQEAVEQVRAVPGAVDTSAYITYRAGKPHVVDDLNLEQQILAGVLPPDIVARRVAAGEFVRMDVNPLHSWQVDFPK